MGPPRHRQIGPLGCGPTAIVVLLTSTLLAMVGLVLVLVTRGGGDRSEWQRAAEEIVRIAPGAVAIGTRSRGGLDLPTEECVLYRTSADPQVVRAYFADYFSASGWSTSGWEGTPILFDAAADGTRVIIRLGLVNTLTAAPQRTPPALGDPYTFEVCAASWEQAVAETRRMRTR